MSTHTHTRIPKYAMVGADLPPPEYNRGNDEDENEDEDSDGAAERLFIA